MHRPFLRQSWAMASVLLNMVGQGMVLSYTACMMPALQATDSLIKADIHMISWISSSAGLSGIPGFLLSSSLMDPYGRKKSHILIILPGIVGWILIYFATNVSMLLAGRIFCGMTAGGSVTLGAVIIGEYTSPKYRGMYLNLKTAAVCIGSMLVHIFGYYFFWKTVALFALAPLFIALGIALTWPESPSWLAAKKKFEASEKSFIWLRGDNEDSRIELKNLIAAQRKKYSEHEKQFTFLTKVVDFFKRFTKRDFLKPSFIVVIGSILLEVSGRHVFPAYAPVMIGEITGSVTKSFYYTLCLDLIITISATSSSILIRMFNRRTLLFSTGIGAFFVVMAACGYLFLASKDIVSNEHKWVPITLFIIYFILANLGCTPIPLALIGEVYPLAHRGPGSAVAGFFLSIMLMAGLQVTPYMLMYLKVCGTYAVFGILMAVCLLILYFVLPETKDKTLQEIEDYFKTGKHKNNFKDFSEEVQLKMLS